MWQTIINHIRNIQRKDDRTKQRYLIVFSSLAMLFVIFLWFLYLNYSLPRVKKEEAAKAGGEESTFKVLGRGFLVIGNDLNHYLSEFKTRFQNLIEQASNAFKNPNEFDIIGNPSPVVTSSLPLPEENSNLKQSTSNISQ